MVNKKLLTLFAILILIFSGCSLNKEKNTEIYEDEELIFEDISNNDNLTNDIPEEEKIDESTLEGNCIANGGKYEPVGKMQTYQCNLPTSDKGKHCNTRTDCEGMCLSIDGYGHCSGWSLNFGCMDIFENNETLTLCID